MACARTSVQMGLAAALVTERPEEVLDMLNRVEGWVVFHTAPREQRCWLRVDAITAVVDVEHDEHEGHG
jgi:transcription termination factor Rho